MYREKKHIYNNFLGIVDVVLSVICFVIAYFIRHWHFEFNSQEYYTVIALIVIIWFILLKFTDLSSFPRSRSYISILVDYLFVIGLGLGILFILLFAFKLQTISRTVIYIFAAINFVVLYISKLFVYSGLKYLRKKGLNIRNIVIFADDKSAEFISTIIKNKEWGYRVNNIFSNSSVIKEKFDNAIDVLPENTDISKYLEENPIDELFYCKERYSLNEVQLLIYSCQEIGISFHLQSPVLFLIGTHARLDYLSNMPFFIFKNTSSLYISLKIKSLIDYLFSSIVLLLSSPFLLIVVLLIKLSSSGPVFFKQIRSGLRGRKFTMYKFRTMVVNAEELRTELIDKNEVDGPVFKIKDDPRITKIGKFLRKYSLDEFPQFINVFKGDMSVVGPRPPIPAEVEEYERWQLRRLSMKPGITCIWQVSGRNETTFTEWMQMDLQYIDNWSLKMDILIFFKTIKTVIIGSGR